MPVLREVLKDHKNSLLVQPDDTLGWIKAIKEIKDHKELREYISINSRQDFEKMYSWNKRAENVLKGIEIN